MLRMTQMRLQAISRIAPRANARTGLVRWLSLKNKGLPAPTDHAQRFIELSPSRKVSISYCALCLVRTKNTSTLVIVVEMRCALVMCLSSVKYVLNRNTQRIGTARKLLWILTFFFPLHVDLVCKCRYVGRQGDALLINGKSQEATIRCKRTSPAREPAPQSMRRMEACRHDSGEATSGPAVERRALVCR